MTGVNSPPTPGAGSSTTLLLAVGEYRDERKYQIHFSSDGHWVVTITYFDGRPFHEQVERKIAVVGTELLCQTMHCWIGRETPFGYASSKDVDRCPAWLYVLTGKSEMVLQTDSLKSWMSRDSDLAVIINKISNGTYSRTPSFSSAANNGSSGI
jgi:hypothetical protein